MTAPDPLLPAPSILQATLRKITERLAGELACPGTAAPDWSELEWTIARAVAAMHGVSPLLARILRWQGPADWVRFLYDQRSHTAKRHARLAELLQLIDRGARERGVAAVALKGVALHALGLYQAGDRPMADIDLLVRPADAARTAQMLESLGLFETLSTWRERVFTPISDHIAGGLGENSHNHLKVELHVRIGERLPWRITETTELVFPRNAQPGLNPYHSRASLMMHLLLHAAGAMSIKSLRLMHLHDLALLSSLMRQQDWDEIRDRGLWWAYPPLSLTSRYYPASIPPRVLAALADGCSRLLRTLSARRTLYEVSHSYLWVDAFPGLEWSQSLREVFEFAANRLRPSAEHIAAREHAARTREVPDHTGWSRLSQGRRILRWITSRPTRPLIIQAISAAVAQAQHPH